MWLRASHYGSPRATVLWIILLSLSLALRERGNLWLEGILSQYRSRLSLLSYWPVGSLGQTAARRMNPVKCLKSVVSRISARWVRKKIIFASLCVTSICIFAMWIPYICENVKTNIEQEYYMNDNNVLIWISVIHMNIRDIPFLLNSPRSSWDFAEPQACIPIMASNTIS